MHECWESINSQIPDLKFCCLQATVKPTLFSIYVMFFIFLSYYGYSYQSIERIAVKTNTSCILRLGPALILMLIDLWRTLKELSVLLSCQDVQGVGGGMWKLKLIKRIGIVSGEEESLTYFVEVFEWLHCIVHTHWKMNQHIWKNKIQEM